MSQLRLEPRKDGVVIAIQAKPASRRNGIQGVHDGALKVSVSAAPEKGKANVAISQVLAAALGIEKSRIVLISGETTRRKRFLVQGTTAEEVDHALRGIHN